MKAAGGTLGACPKLEDFKLEPLPFLFVAKREKLFGAMADVIALVTALRSGSDFLVPQPRKGRHNFSPPLREDGIGLLKMISTAEMGRVCHSCKDTLMGIWISTRGKICNLLSSHCHSLLGKLHSLQWGLCWRTGLCPIGKIGCPVPFCQLQ